MIKVLHLITDLNKGGAEMMLYKLLSRMDRLRFQNVVVSMKPIGPLGADIKALDVPVFTLGIRSGALNPHALLRLLRLLRKERLQILQTWLYHADLLGILAGKLAYVPAIVWNLRCAELDKNDHSKFLFLILKMLTKLSHMPKAIIVNSKIGRLSHECLGYKPARWVIISNGFDSNLFCPSQDARSLFRRKLRLPEQTPLIGLVARFNPMKDHMNFLYAASQLHKKRSDVHFVLVGQGVDEKNDLLMDQITALDLHKCLHLLGERDDIAHITAALDIASSSSYSEGFSNVIGEGMASGVPCVVTDVGDSAYIVGDTGLVVPPRDPHALAAAWNRLLSMSENDRMALGLSGRERIVSLFSLDAITNQYEKLYDEIVKEA